MTAQARTTYKYTTGNNEQIEHHSVLARGGFGEVHKVLMNSHYYHLLMLFEDD